MSSAPAARLVPRQATLPWTGAGECAACGITVYDLEGREMSNRDDHRPSRRNITWAWRGLVGLLAIWLVTVIGAIWAENLVLGLFAVVITLCVVWGVVAVRRATGG
jgi:hypothetical protein